MSGHSKWASIKHKKAATDAKKGKAFTQAANMITIAAKQGGGDSKMNFSLRLAIDKARSVNMPAANIERAIKRGTGELGGSAPEEIIYEGYSPGGVAVLVETMTDNRNRTASDVRSIFSKSGGNMAENGAVAYLFDQRGEIEISKEKDASEKIELAIIDSGADDFEETENSYLIYTDYKNLQKVKENLEENNLKIVSAEMTRVAKNEIKINDQQMAEKVLKLIDSLEELEDVTTVHANFDIAEEILEKIN